jgi:hypothetical protein
MCPKSDFRRCGDLIGAKPMIEEAYEVLVGSIGFGHRESIHSALELAALRYAESRLDGAESLYVQHWPRVTPSVISI